MKIFISSLIAGFEDMRAAAVAAVRSLGHEPVTAETFDPGLTSPRIACLKGVRDSDLVVMMLGSAYGAVQPNSDLSATHEEWREAKDRRPVIAFVQDGVDRDARQAEFVREVQDWTGGLFRGGFRDADDLRDQMTRTIHRLELSSATAAVDATEMLTRAQALIPREDRGFVRMTGPLLHIAVVGGPAQTILRPMEIEKPELARMLLREATYGGHPVFDPAHGSKQDLLAGMLRLVQDTGAEILLDERGSIRLSVPVARGTGMMGALIEENVIDALDRGLARAADILGRIDDAQRLSRLVVAISLAGNGVMGWRTRGEDAASPNSMTMSNAFSQGERPPIHFQPPDRPRAALEFDRTRMVEDLVTLLRRQFR
jgi:Domain of unknown function (DUF4062)